MSGCFSALPTRACQSRDARAPHLGKQEQQRVKGRCVAGIIVIVYSRCTTASTSLAPQCERSPVLVGRVEYSTVQFSTVAACRACLSLLFARRSRCRWRFAIRSLTSALIRRHDTRHKLNL